MDNKYYVYAFLREDNSPYYIGKGHGNRAYSTKRTVKKPKNEERIKILVENLTEADSFLLEMFLIKYFGRKGYDECGILYNQTKGGEGSSGYKHSKESLEKMSKSRTGLKRSKEAIEKTANKNRGRKNSKETIEKFKEVNSGVNNPAFGKIWINNGTQNKFVTTDTFQQEYPNWTKGRLMKRNAEGKFTS